MSNRPPTRFPSDAAGFVRRHASGIAAAAVVIAAFVTRIPTLGQPLLGIHAFRQTQTAYGSLMLHEHGFDLLHAELPILGPPWQVPFEMPLFQASAALLIGAGMDPDAADRLASLCWFTLSAILLWVLARRLAGNGVAAVATAWYAFMPLSIVWSRNATIEYLAVACALAAAVAMFHWLDTQRWRWLGAAVAMASVTGVVKVATLAAWLMLVVAILGAIFLKERPRSPGRLVGLTAIIGISIMVSALWTRHADAIKAASPWTDDLTSAHLVGWNLGTIGQHLDPGVWAALASNLVLFVLGVLGLILLPFAVIAIGRSPGRPELVGIALVAIVSPIVFLNLYAWHDYYWAATSPAWALLIGLGAVTLVRRARTPRRGYGLVASLLAGAIVVGGPYWVLAYSGTVDPSDVNGQALRVAALTQPDDLVIVEGNDYSPEVLYHSRRRGIALPARELDTAEWQALKGTEPGVVELVHPDTISRVSILKAWPWVGPVDQQLYRVSRTESGLGSLPVAWSLGGRRAVREALAGRYVTTVSCGGPPFLVSAPPAGEDLWVEVNGAPETEARAWVVAGLGPVPASGLVRIRGATAEISCAQTEAVHLRTVMLPSAP